MNIEIKEINLEPGESITITFPDSKNFRDTISDQFLAKYKTKSITLSVSEDGTPQLIYTNGELEEIGYNLKKRLKEFEIEC